MLTFVKSGSVFLFQADFSAEFTKGCFVSRNHIEEIPLFCNAGTREPKGIFRFWIWAYCFLRWNLV